MSESFASLIAACAVFVCGHFLLSAAGLRASLVKRLGEQTFTFLYSAIAAVALIWMIAAYGDAPYVELWPRAPALRWIPVLVMPLAAFLLVCGVSAYNPTAVMRKFDPTERDPAPGVLKITRHPVMWGIGLWALAHIPPNGDIASLILFGSFAVLALVGTTQIEAKRRAREPDGFRRFAEITSNVPFVALFSAKTRAFWKTAYSKDPVKTVWSEIGLARVAMALAVYVALVVLHPWIAGVPVH